VPGAGVVVSELVCPGAGVLAADVSRADVVPEPVCPGAGGSKYLRPWV
jgi:hypothetical protein